MTNKIVKYINTQIEGGYVYKRYATGNEAGKPDLTGVFRGYRLEFEVKSKSREPSGLEALRLRLLDSSLGSDFKAFYELGLSIASKRQAYWIKRFSSLGAISGVVFDLRDIDIYLSYF